jgi:hypothetical protein
MLKKSKEGNLIFSSGRFGEIFINLINHMSTARWVDGLCDMNHLSEVGKEMK